MAVSAHVGIKKNICLFRLLRLRAGRGRSLTASKARKHFDLQPATGCRPGSDTATGRRVTPSFAARPRQPVLLAHYYGGTLFVSMWIAGE
jgi:hypothetical protein